MCCGSCWLGGLRNAPKQKPVVIVFAESGKTLDRPVPQANAESMKLLAVSLVLLFAANAQEPYREYLIRLNDADFPASLRAKGITPLHHAGNIWAVRTSDKKTLRQTTEEFTPATNITIEFQPGSKDMAHAVVEAGGIVTRDYHSISAMSAIVPTSKIGDIQRLPGVKRVHKTRAYSAFHTAHE
jgi:hypothetical protein